MKKILILLTLLFSVSLFSIDCQKQYNLDEETCEQKSKKCYKTCVVGDKNMDCRVDCLSMTLKCILDMDKKFKICKNNNSNNKPNNKEMEKCMNHCTNGLDRYSLSKLFDGEMLEHYTNKICEEKCTEIIKDIIKRR